jgi:hypothetical protein
VLRGGGREGRRLLWEGPAAARGGRLLGGGRGERTWNLALYHVENHNPNQGGEFINIGK